MLDRGLVLARGVGELGVCSGRWARWWEIGPCEAQD